MAIKKAWLTTTVPRSKAVQKASGDQHAIFDQLVGLLEPYADRLDNRKNTPEHYELWTLHNFRSQTMKPRNKRGVLFAGVLIIKNRVGFYFYPLHIDEKFADHISADLKPFWKGNSAFHFQKPVSETKLQSLQHLIETGWEYFTSNKWIV